jgi:hypothetical protein
MTVTRTNSSAVTRVLRGLGYEGKLAVHTRMGLRNKTITWLTTDPRQGAVVDGLLISAGYVTERHPEGDYILVVGKAV